MKDSKPEVFVPLTFAPQSRVCVLVRASEGAGPVFSRARSAVRQLDPALAPPDMMSMDDRIDASRTAIFSTALLMCLCGTLATSLAIAAVYAVAAANARRRRRDIAVRMALGLTFVGAAAMFFRGAVRLSVGGCVCGLVLAVTALRVMQSSIGEVVMPSAFGAGLVCVIISGVVVVAQVAPLFNTVRPGLARLLADSW